MKASVQQSQRGGSAGFTLVEMVMVIIIVGILGAFVAPRFMQNPEMSARGFADQVKAMLRYAQKSAIAQHDYVCVAFSTTSVELSINVTPDCPGSALASADGNVYSRLDAPRDVRFAALPANFYFDSLGRPDMNSAQRLQITGTPIEIVIEAETGYVH